ncbi:MAG TPA: hypothetical protein VE130_03380 [Nitrososphaeraceae archaeon]|jgi:hypothetical protein|nr:hypothetical protein [Nitrososphaeraceae archaeon]
MVVNLSSEIALTLMIKDFKGAWNTLAGLKDHRIGRGNFIFGFMAMNLLEFICRLCRSDPTRKTLRDFSNNLNTIESKYFTHIPSSLPKGSGILNLNVRRDDFTLPYLDDQNKNNMLLTLLYDLIRNGVGHQYQQLVVDLKNGGNFFITIDGPFYGNIINKDKRYHHLFCRIEKNGDINLTVFPQILLVDFEDAVKQSKLLERGLTIGHLKRYYDIDSQSLVRSLENGGVECVHALH